ncbi:hypothetical protein J6590_090462 [Homalodisca vitripennis]|nr:hypothetical protein J6590_090462 [Homalodisca vitripennis]
MNVKFITYYLHHTYPVPKVFALAFSIVKNFLNDYTISKIQIFKAEPGKWGPALLRQIPAENLPQQYGGDMVDPDGDPRCPSKVMQGLQGGICWNKGK